MSARSNLVSGAVLERLFQKPDYQIAKEFSAEGVEAVYIDHEPYRGKKTRVFAWMGLPQLKEGERCPAMVLLHGGGGTAFDEWVRLWNDRGYAAICIDQCGCQPQNPPVDGAPQVENPGGGPPGWDASVSQINEPLTDQWQFHAITAAIRAHSLLAHHPAVDADRIGVTGISWGGYLTCLVAGVDDRLKCAVPVYGCGFLGDNSCWKYELFANSPPADAKKWLLEWDPAVFLPHAAMPFLWVNGTNDFAYPMDSMQKSYDTQSGPHQLCLRVEMPHGHLPGWEPREIMDFADHILRGEPALTEITDFGHDAASLWTRYQSVEPIKAAVVCYTRSEGYWADRKYNELPAVIDHDNQRVSAPIPSLSTVCYLNLIDRQDRVTSTRHVCAMEPEERYLAIDNVCAWPNLTQLPDGTLAVAIHNQPIHGRWHGDVELWVSTDDGRLWEKRSAAAPGEPPGNRMDVAAGCAANGDLIVISSGWTPVLEPGTDDPDFDFSTRQCLEPRVCRSADGGYTWERADTVTAPDDSEWCIPFGDIVEGPDGLAAAFYAGPRDDSRNAAWILRSTDDGRTWGDSSMIAADDYNETDILHLGRGALVGRMPHVAGCAHAAVRLR